VENLNGVEGMICETTNEQDECEASIETGDQKVVLSADKNSNSDLLGKGGHQGI
jgi:hypothetical protein